MTREEMLLTSQIEALRELVKAMEKTITTQKETIAALEKREAIHQPVYVPPTYVPPTYVPSQSPTIAPQPWGGGFANSLNSVGKPPFISSFTLGAFGGRCDSRL